MLLLRKKNFVISLFYNALFLLVTFTVTAFVITPVWLNIDHKKATEELLEINKRVLAQKNYSLSVNYKTYKGHSSETVYESHTGKVYKDGIYYRADLMGTITIQTKELRLVLDTVKKTISVSNASEAMEMNFDPVNYLKVMDLCRSVKSADIDQYRAFRFEMKAKRGIVAQELYFDKEFLKRLVYYYANEHEVRTNNELKKEIVYPRLVIELTDFRVLTRQRSQLFDTDNILKIKGKSIQVEPKYKNFKLNDNRFYK